MTKRKPKRFIRWINLSTIHVGYWRSVEGRFYIVPRYGSSAYPIFYGITDHAERIMGVSEYRSFETIQAAKAWAEEKIRRSLEIDGVEV